jgi:hypothetical protein
MDTCALRLILAATFVGFRLLPDVAHRVIPRVLAGIPPMYALGRRFDIRRIYLGVRVSEPGRLARQSSVAGNRASTRRP